MLTHHGERIGQCVKRNGQSASRDSHAEFIVLQFFALLVEYTHTLDCNLRRERE